MTSTTEDAYTTGVSADTIRRYLTDFYKPITMPGGWSFDHVETIKTIDLYYMGKFKTGLYDDQNFRKFFVNIVKPSCDIAYKFVELDTKDLILVPLRSRNDLKVWFLQQRLKKWIKDNSYDILLNEIAYDYCKYGHFVIKKTRDGWKKVNLQNLRLDTTSQWLHLSPYVAELMIMNEAELKEMQWDSKKKEELLKLGPDKDGQYYIYDCYYKTVNGWSRTIKGSLFTTKHGNNYKHAIETEMSERSEYVPEVVLFEEEVDELPYREDKWEDIPGRWLGFGNVEYLFDNQIATNEAEALERKGLALTSLKIYQTADDMIGGSNIVTNSRNGDIVKADQRIEPILTEERNLPEFNATRARWDQNTREKTFSFEISRGENLPSRTPIGVANIQSSMVISFYQAKQEKLGIFIKNFISKDIIPSFSKDTLDEHIITFAGSSEDIEKIDKTVSEIFTEKAVVDYAKKHGFFPPKRLREDLKSRIMEDMKRDKARFVKIPKNFYQNAKYYVDIIVTNEQMDTATRSQTVSLGIQMLGSNPALLQTPGLREMFFRFLTLGGVSPVDIGFMRDALSEESGGQQNVQQLLSQIQQGGSLSPRGPSGGGQATLRAPSNTV